MQRLILPLALLPCLTLTAFASANQAAACGHDGTAPSDHHTSQHPGPNRDYDWFSDSSASSRPQYQFYTRDHEVFGFAGGDEDRFTSDHYGRYDQRFDWTTHNSWFNTWYGQSDRGMPSR